MASFLKVLAAIKDVAWDRELIQYLDFLSDIVPIVEIDHQHVIAKIGDSDIYDMLCREIQTVGDDMFQEEFESLFLEYRNVKNLGYRITSGKVIQELKKSKVSGQFDVIALGKGEKGFGSIAKNVIRKIGGNTLLVPKGCEHRFRNILVPVDLSSHSEKLMAQALAIQEASSEPVWITCFHAYEVPILPAYKVLRTDARIKVETRERVKAAFEGFMAKFRSPDTRIRSMLVEEANNLPSHYVLEGIRKTRANLVVMGTQSHTMFDTWLGSTAEKIISRNNTCPMLIVNQ